MAKDKPKKKPGPEADTLKIEGPWEAAIDKALSKKRPVGGFPKLPSRPVRPKRDVPPLKLTQPMKPRKPAPSPDPIDVAEMRRKPTRAEIQAEMLRARCTRSEAVSRLKARKS